MYFELVYFIVGDLISRLGRIDIYLLSFNCISVYIK